MRTFFALFVVLWLLGGAAQAGSLAAAARQIAATVQRQSTRPTGTIIAATPEGFTLQLEGGARPRRGQRYRSLGPEGPTFWEVIAAGERPSVRHLTGPKPDLPVAAEPFPAITTVVAPVALTDEDPLIERLLRLIGEEFEDDATLDLLVLPTDRPLPEPGSPEEAAERAWLPGQMLLFVERVAVGAQDVLSGFVQPISPLGPRQTFSITLSEGAGTRSATGYAEGTVTEHFRVDAPAMGATFFETEGEVLLALALPDEMQVRGPGGTIRARSPHNRRGTRSREVTIIPVRQPGCDGTLLVLSSPGRTSGGFRFASGSLAPTRLPPTGIGVATLGADLVTATAWDGAYRLKGPFQRWFRDCATGRWVVRPDFVPALEGETLELGSRIDARGVWFLRNGEGLRRVEGGEAMNLPGIGVPAHWGPERLILHGSMLPPGRGDYLAISSVDTLRHRVRWKSRRLEGTIRAIHPADDGAVHLAVADWEHGTTRLLTLTTPLFDFLAATEATEVTTGTPAPANR